jgi:putative component of membrane protein insertase Oxa1/YidC/SpoIIIJ protein YidD
MHLIAKSVTKVSGNSCSYASSASRYDYIAVRDKELLAGIFVWRRAVKVTPPHSAARNP